MKTHIKENLLRRYEKGYKKNGANFQRKYPNEELCRFMGRHFFHLDKKKKSVKKILEAGCGSGGNLWMIAQEGFNTYGLDFSKESIKILNKILKKKKLKANLHAGDMTSMPYKDNFFDCVIDVFSSTHLNKTEGKKFIQQASSVLKKNGFFYSYFPLKKSSMFKSSKKKLLDQDTIIKINKARSAYNTDNLPLRFTTKKNYIDILKKNKIKTIYSEEILKTYFNGKEKFYFLSIVGKKI
jgi:ubiquinone/menaquinone biosynthesis C-methylase UbiE